MSVRTGVAVGRLSEKSALGTVVLIQQRYMMRSRLARFMGTRILVVAKCRDSRRVSYLVYAPIFTFWPGPFFDVESVA